MNKKVLIACEESQAVTIEMRKVGVEAYSCDLEPCSGGHPEWHIQGDVIPLLNVCPFKSSKILQGWDMIIAFPPCTFLCTTGNKWFKPEFKSRFPDRQKKRESAIDFFLMIANAKCERIAIENPVGIMSTVNRKPDQYIHPYYFGDPHSKKTCLWLKGLPLLKQTNIVEPIMYTYKNGKKDPIWHVESMKLKPKERAKIRSKTFPGIAKAMAAQWNF